MGTLNLFILVTNRVMASNKRISGDRGTSINMLDHVHDPLPKYCLMKEFRVCDYRQEPTGGPAGGLVTLTWFLPSSLRKNANLISMSIFFLEWYPQLEKETKYGMVRKTATLRHMGKKGVLSWVWELLQKRVTVTKPVHLEQSSSWSLQENPVTLQMWPPDGPWKGSPSCECGSYSLCGSSDWRWAWDCCEDDEKHIEWEDSEVMLSPSVSVCYHICYMTLFYLPFSLPIPRKLLSLDNISLEPHGEGCSGHMVPTSHGSSRALLAIDSPAQNLQLTWHLLWDISTLA